MTRRAKTGLDAYPAGSRALNPSSSPFSSIVRGSVSVCLCVCVMCVSVRLCVCVDVWSKRNESECLDMCTCDRPWILTVLEEKSVVT